MKLIGYSVRWKPEGAHQNNFKARDKVTGALCEKGIDFDMRNLKPEDMDEFLEALSELELGAVNNNGDIVKVYVE